MRRASATRRPARFAAASEPRGLTFYLLLPFLTTVLVSGVMSTKGAAAAALYLNAWAVVLNGHPTLSCPPRKITGRSEMSRSETQVGVRKFDHVFIPTGSAG
jgi:hypothetical protein